MNSILVIVPAYNESESIEGVIDELEGYPDYDYVIINDGSTDDTEAICKKRGANCVSLPLNLGIGGAVQTGYKYALRHGYEYAVQFDGDGQHDAAYISFLIREAKESKANMVIGSRFMDADDGDFQSTKLRRLGIRLISACIRVFSGLSVSDPTSGFRLCDRCAINYFCRDYPADYPEPESIVGLRSQGMKIVEVPVKMRERQGGVSSIRAFSSIVYMVKVMTAILIRSSRK